MILITNNMESRPGEGGTAIHLKDDIYIDADYLEEISDIQPVKEGRWVAVENDLDYYPFMCSECYETVIKRTNRCPRCGVKMEAKENEND